LIHWQFGVDGRAGGDGDFDGGGIVAFAEVGVGPEIVVDLVPSVEPVFAGAEIRKRELAVVAGDLLDGWRGGVGGDEGDDGAGEIGNDAGDVMVPAEGLRTMSMWVEVRIWNSGVGRSFPSIWTAWTKQPGGRERGSTAMAYWPGPKGELGGSELRFGIRFREPRTPLWLMGESLSVRLMRAVTFGEGLMARTMPETSAATVTLPVAHAWRLFDDS